MGNHIELLKLLETNPGKTREEIPPHLQFLIVTCKRRGLVTADQWNVALTDLGRVEREESEAANAGQTSRGPRPAKRKAGRPKKDEKDSATKVVAALTKWHGYQDGSVDNYEPATNRGLADKEYGLGPNALNRFLKGRGGHKAYVAACCKGSISLLLQSWRGELLDRHADILVNKDQLQSELSAEDDD